MERKGKKYKRRLGAVCHLLALPTVLTTAADMREEDVFHPGNKNTSGFSILLATSPQGPSVPFATGGCGKGSRRVVGCPDKRASSGKGAVRTCGLRVTEVGCRLGRGTAGWETVT